MLTRSAVYIGFLLYSSSISQNFNPSSFFSSAPGCKQLSCTEYPQPHYTNIINKSKTIIFPFQLSDGVSNPLEKTLEIITLDSRVTGFNYIYYSYDGRVSNAEKNILDYMSLKLSKCTITRQMANDLPYIAKKGRNFFKTYQGCANYSMNIELIYSTKLADEEVITMPMKGTDGRPVRFIHPIVISFIRK